ncbi:MAG: NAD(P)/FAD-dependent oxidoreductase, partial [Anaerovoracaceae bacterium]
IPQSATAKQVAAIKQSATIPQSATAKQVAATKQSATADVIFAEEGEIQFTKDGLSGICVFNLTRHIEIENGKTLEEGLREYKISVDFLPDIDIKDLLEQRKTIKDFTAKDLLRTFVREPLALDILRQAQISPNKMASQLEKNQLISLEKVLHNWQVSIKMLKGWKFAQVTKGGVDLGEINLQTMESKLVRGLFFAGEVIDYDGPCGGYNLQNAWETAIKAGKEMSNV